MASSTSDQLLGVRDGFLRYFHRGLHSAVPIAVVPQAGEDGGRAGLPLSDEEMLQRARRRAAGLAARFGDTYQFYAACEGGLHCLELDGAAHYFVRSWTALLSVAGEAWGGSGSLEIPVPLIQGLDSRQVPYAVPGTRRQGGMISSLTNGLETRRDAIAQSTLHALSTLFYGILNSHGGSRGEAPGPGAGGLGV